MEPPSPKRQRQGGAAASPGHDGGSGAGPGPSFPAPTAAVQQGAAPAGLLDVLALLLSREALELADRRALRLTCRGARLAVDAAVRSLDLRKSAGLRSMPAARLPGLRAFVARLHGLQELLADAAAPSLNRVVVQVVAAGGGVASRLRKVRLCLASKCTVGPRQSEMLRDAFPGLEVRRELWASRRPHPGRSHHPLRCR
jgi:hypothetical protein